MIYDALVAVAHLETTGEPATVKAVARTHDRHHGWTGAGWALVYATRLQYLTSARTGPNSSGYHTTELGRAWMAAFARVLDIES